jgi:hypothetical protein
MKYGAAIDEPVFIAKNLKQLSFMTADSLPGVA